LAVANQAVDSQRTSPQLYLCVGHIGIFGEALDPDRYNTTFGDYNLVGLPRLPIAHTRNHEHITFWRYINCDPSWCALATLSHAKGDVMEPFIESRREFEVGLPKIATLRLD
jgi:hypothetical protein